MEHCPSMYYYLEEDLMAGLIQIENSQHTQQAERLEKVAFKKQTLSALQCTVHQFIHYLSYAILVKTKNNMVRRKQNKQYYHIMHFVHTCTFTG